MICEQVLQQPCRINQDELLRIVEDVVRKDIVAMLEGYEEGATETENEGYAYEHRGLHDYIRQWREQGVTKFVELLVLDWIPVPMCPGVEGEPRWYLTVSLNADV